MVKWEIFYSDGTSLTSEEIDPFEIQNHEDVQVIIQEDDENSWVTLALVPFFVYDDRGKGWKWWRVEDHFGLDHYLRQPGPRCVLFGTWIEDEDFRRILNGARDKWGEKTSYNTVEKHP